MTKSYRDKIVAGAPSRCGQALSTLAYQLNSTEKQTLANAVIAKAG